MGLGDAHRQRPEPGGLVCDQLLGGAGVVVDPVDPVDLGGDGLDLLPQAELGPVEHPERAGFLGRLHHCLGQLDGTGTAVGEVGADGGPYPHRGGDGQDGIVLGGEVLGEGVDGHHRVHAVVSHDLEVLEEVGRPQLDLGRVLLEHLGRQQAPGDHPMPSRMDLERPDGGHHRGVGHQAGGPARDVEEPVRPRRARRSWTVISPALRHLPDAPGPVDVADGFGMHNAAPMETGVTPRPEEDRRSHSGLTVKRSGPP